MVVKHQYLYGRTQQQLLSIPDLISWGDHFSVRHSGIDAQHKEIFNLGYTFYENWCNGGDIELLQPAMEKLVSLLKAHFLYEEDILRKINYEDLDEHIAEHQSMLKELEVMKEKVNERLLRKDDQRVSQGQSMISPAWPMLQFFMGFAIWHVSYCDMDYQKVLATNNIPRPNFEIP